MARWTHIDRLLLLGLLPLFVLCFSLHVREVLRTGLAQPPVFAIPGIDSDAYPTVGGLRLERGIDWNDLRVGDRLIRIGDVDLRGVGYAGFDAITLEQAGLGLIVPLIFERGGERHVLQLRMSQYAQPWFRVPFLLSFVLVGLLILLRAPGSRQAQAVFAGLVSFAVAECHFFGGPRLQSYASIYLFNFGGAISAFLLLRWLILFPEELDARDRLSPKWAWLAALWIVIRLNYFLGGPIPPAQMPESVLAVDASLGVIGLCISTWNYFHSSRIGRRRIKWVVFGMYMVLTPWLASALASYIGVPQFDFHRMFEVLVLAQMALPLGILIAVVRFNVFDIDRLLSATASYTLAVAALAGITFSAVPAAATALAGVTGWTSANLQVPLGAGLVGLGLVLGRRLRPRVDRFFFPERAALQEGVARLLRDLAHCRNPTQVIRLVETRITAAARPTRSTLLTRKAYGMTSSAKHQPEPPMTIPLQSPIVRGLEADPSPRLIEESEDPTLARLEARLLLPLRSGNDLMAIIVLGPKRSGDIYTATERTLLDSVCERASAALLSLRDAASLAAERSRGDILEGEKSAAEHVNESRARFLAAASHDLRQPLHALGLFASTLSERIDEEDAPALVSRIQQSTASLSTMMDALLDMSRLDAGAIAPTRSEFEIGPMIDRLVSELEPGATEKGIVLERESTSERVCSDHVLLGRILQNLLGNAVRYTDFGKVAVSYRAEGDLIRIEVSDTGPGIPADRQVEIFAEFTRIENDRADGGLGLGLSIVERMAGLLGHELGLKSSPGNGSRFWIDVDRAGSATAAAPPIRVDFTGRLVGVIDDDLEVLEGTGRLLQEWGCDTWLAQSMEEALESWENAPRPPDALIVDYRLAGTLTGVEVVQKLSEFSGQHVPAVVVTGETMETVLVEIQAAGLPHLTKPVAPFRLRAMLLELLRT